MRLFLSIELPREVSAELEIVQQKIQSLGLIKGTFVPPKNLHITLAFLGKVEEASLVLLQSHLKKITVEPFSLTLQQIELRPHVLWITTNSEPLTNLATLIHKASVQALGMSESDKQFNGHITLARIKKIDNKKKVQEALKTIDVHPLTWPVTEFTLQKSTTFQEGPQYEAISRFS